MNEKLNFERSLELYTKPNRPRNIQICGCEINYISCDNKSDAITCCYTQRCALHTQLLDHIAAARRQKMSLELEDCFEHYSSSGTHPVNDTP